MYIDVKEEIEKKNIRLVRQALVAILKKSPLEVLF